MMDITNHVSAAADLLEFKKKCHDGFGAYRLYENCIVHLLLLYSYACSLYSVLYSKYAVIFQSVAVAYT